MIDLHTHSHRSDGTLPPGQVVLAAHQKGVSLLSLTDHDTVSGIEEARGEAQRLKIVFIPGIEINTVELDQVHILGYGLDVQSPSLKRNLEAFRTRRRSRVERILKKLQDLKIPVGMEDVEQVSKESLGRPHVADALRKNGYVKSRQEAFERFLMRGRPAYVEPLGPNPKEAIETIREAGGIPVLAHPGMVSALNAGSSDGALRQWVRWGLGGIEAYYPSHSVGQTLRFLEEAGRYDLLATVGSDFHGPRTGREKIGIMKVPEEAEKKILEALC